MTTRLEEELTEAMREHTATLSLRTDIVAAAARRHRRHTILRRTAYTLGVLGLAGVLTAAVGLMAPVGTTTASDQSSTNVTTVDGPQAAASTTAEKTFRVQITSTVIDRVRGQSHQYSGQTTGAVDPRLDRGYVDLGRGLTLVIFDGHYYLVGRDPKPRKESVEWAGEFFAMSDGRSGLTLDDVLLHREKLIDKLRKLGEVSHVGRSGGVDTYRYRYHVPVSRDYAAHWVTGEVHVNAAKQIVKFTQDMTVTTSIPEIADRDRALTYHDVWTYSDFGIPVKVEDPTA